VAQDHEQATHAAKVEKSEAALDFGEEAQTEYNRFRAFTPSPGAFLVTRMGRIRLSQVRLSHQEGDPGTVHMPNLVAFKGGSLELIEVQPEGKRRMAGKDFFNGYRLRNGEKLV
jgi:methionyl-tRNA formyltransferase